MSSKIAICQCADSGPLESLVLMLRSVGYRCFVPSNEILAELRNIGCDTILSIDHLVKNWGYDPPMCLPVAGLQMMDTCDLYVELKAHRSGPKIWARWPHLKGKTLWYRINGGKPEHVIKPSGEDCGDECDPPCPILTPNLWYADAIHEVRRRLGDTEVTAVEPTPWVNKAYAMWPPFYRFDEYYPVHHRVPSTDPICLVHNLQGWGYGELIGNMRRLGVKCYGAGSPDGLIPHSHVPQMLSTAVAMVHLKSSDAPGYALYEALAAACPIICTRRLIWRNRMEDLLIPGKTCLVFDRETHDALSPDDVVSCTSEVKQALEFIRKFPKQAHEIGMAGRLQLKKLMWDEVKDHSSFEHFMFNHFGT